MYVLSACSLSTPVAKYTRIKYVSPVSGWRYLIIFLLEISEKTPNVSEEIFVIVLLDKLIK